MNLTILQPPDRCVHYGQAYRIDHSTDSSYETPLHYHYLAAFPGLLAYPQPFNLLDPVPPVQ